MRTVIESWKGLSSPRGLALSAAWQSPFGTLTSPFWTSVSLFCHLFCFLENFMISRCSDFSLETFFFAFFLCPSSLLAFWALGCHLVTFTQWMPHKGSWVTGICEDPGVRVTQVGPYHVWQTEQREYKKKHVLQGSRDALTDTDSTKSTSFKNGKRFSRARFQERMSRKEDRPLPHPLQAYHPPAHPLV